MAKKIFKLLGFIFMVICPIVIFGGVIPYTHEGKIAGFTTMGYIALAVIAFILSLKLYALVKKQKESLTRGLILFAFPCAWWFIIWLGINKLVSLATSIAAYWDRVLIFVILGGVCYIASEAMGVKE